MKEEITEFQPAEDSVTRIQCDGCTTTWDNRDDDGVNYVVLDATIERKAYDGWEKRNNRWNSTSLSSISANRMTGTATAEYCDTCWDRFFTAGPAVEVTESEYYVEEETTEEYYCDFCGDGIGESPDHDVSVNPRIEKERKTRSNNVLHTKRETVETVRSLGESVSCGHRGRKYAKRDDSYDCCHSCAQEMFSFRRGDVGLLRKVGAVVSDMFIQLKEIMLFDGV